ncbi:NUDIX hydrolase [Micromonospora rosaria]|uniref:NUDIX hydrolase n=1 Tax=Micromonospora rosaria TaxID=47874 RepID=UPI00083682FE|nr:NUDIX domain-containing protein [Micromonospora rosaria]
MVTRRRIGAYGLCRDGDRVLLVRGSARSALPGAWQLPGGGLRHAEHPAHAMARRFAAETGLAVEPTGLRAAVADVSHLAGDTLHTDRLVFDVAVRSGALRAEADGGTDEVAWLSLAEAARLPLTPFTAEALGLPVTPPPATVPAPPAGGPPDAGPAPAATGASPRAAETLPTGAGVTPGVAGVPGGGATPAGGPASADRGQRFAAYGLVTDPAGRLLLTRIAEGYPGGGRWHLPGGGTDPGEQPVAGLLRELVEETGQLGRVVDLLGVDNLHNPAALGPEGRPMDWHNVRVVYRVLVDVATEAVVTEAAGGSTAQAAWFAPDRVAELPLTEVAADMTGRYRA